MPTFFVDIRCRRSWLISSAHAVVYAEHVAAAVGQTGRVKGSASRRHGGNYLSADTYAGEWLTYNRSLQCHNHLHPLFPIPLLPALSRRPAGYQTLFLYLLYQTTKIKKPNRPALEPGLAVHPSNRSSTRTVTATCLDAVKGTVGWESVSEWV